MTRLFVLTISALSFLFFTSCKKAEQTAPSANIATAFVTNLNVISAGFTPTSLQSNAPASVGAQSDPCAGVTDFAVCQSNLIREYLKIGKSAVDSLSQLASAIGGALGEVPDNNSGTSANGKISWNKTSSTVWSILNRGNANATVSYFSVNGGVYTLKVDKNNAITDAADQQVEATVNFTDSDNWSVDVYFGNKVCDATKPKDPSKAHIKLTKAAGIWSGKAMLYVPRWESPGTTVNCSTTGSEIAMYTDFVGNNTSTKAALYLIPTSNATTTYTNFDLPNFCTNFTSSCGGSGQPTTGLLSGYLNNWCTTGAGTPPQWNNNCTSNTTVSGASFSSAANWTTPAALKVKTVTMPTSL